MGRCLICTLWKDPPHTAYIEPEIYLSSCIPSLLAVESKDHASKKCTLKACFAGTDAVGWMMCEKVVADERQAKSVCQLLLDMGKIVSAAGGRDTRFRMGTYYRHQNREEADLDGELAVRVRVRDCQCAFG